MKTKGFTEIAIKKPGINISIRDIKRKRLKERGMTKAEIIIVESYFEIFEIRYAKEFADYFGIEDENGYKMLISKDNSKETIFAKNIVIYPSGHVRLTNIKDKKNGEIVYVKNLLISTGIQLKTYVKDKRVYYKQKEGGVFAEYNLSLKTQKEC